jgi:hypothetical protein
MTLYRKVWKGHVDGVCETSDQENMVLNAGDEEKKTERYKNQEDTGKSILC